MQIVEQRPVWQTNLNVGYNAFITRRKDFISAGIRWFSRWDDLPGVPPVSHAFIISGPNETIEAFGNGVGRGTLSAYLNDPNVALLIRVPSGYTEDLGQRIVAEAAKHIGDRYGYVLIAAMALTNTILGHGIDKATGGWLSRKVDGWADGKREEICSELVAIADAAQPELAGRGILKNPASTIKPVDLMGDAVIYQPGAVELIP